jgi:predicted dehydrogenase
LQNITIHYTHGLKTNACHWIDLALMMFGKPNWVTAEMSPIPSPYPDDPNATILLGYDQFHLQLLPLMSPQEGFCSGDMILTYEKERIIVPDPTMYLAKHAKRWIEIDGLLEETKIDFEIKNLKNDFLPFLNQVIKDITTGQSDFMNSNDMVQSLKIIECAQSSAENHCRVKLE